MNLTTWLDVAIGLAIVYLGASLFVTIIGEYVSQLLNLRGRTLWDAIRTLIGDEELRARLAKNPALKHFFEAPGADGTDAGEELEKRRRASPSYVDPVVVARALLAASTNGGATNGKAELPPTLQQAVGAVGEKTEEMVAAVSHWVDSSLTMLGERYKRRQRTISLAVGAVVAVVLNLDTVALTKRLYRDKEARDAVAAVALDVTSKTDKTTLDRCTALAPQKLREDASCVSVAALVDSVRLRNESLGRLPIGWGEDAAQPAAPEAPAGGDAGASGAQRKIVPISAASSGPQGQLASEPPALPVRVWRAIEGHLVGWVLTSLALALGAPFWFDLLGKVVNIRHGMRRPEVKPALPGGSGDKV